MSGNSAWVVNRHSPGVVYDTARFRAFYGGLVRAKTCFQCSCVGVLPLLRGIPPVVLLRLRFKLCTGSAF